MQSSTMREADESRINSIITQFAKTQSNILKYSEIFMMLLDRNAFNHKFTFGSFQKIFELSQNVKNNKPLDKDSLQGQRIIGREQLIFIFNEIAKILYKPNPNYQQRFYNEFLSEKVDVSEGQFSSERVPTFDDINKKLYSQEAIAELTKYEDELRNIYLIYLIQNYFSMAKSRRLLLSQRQITLQNKKWPFTSLILYLKQSQTTPHLITIDRVQQIVRLIIPHINNKQQQFYSRHVITDTYHKDGQNHETTKHPGDPGMYFHQFLLFVGRLAWETYPRDLEKKSIQQVIQRYFNYTFFRKNQNINTQPLPQLNRKMIKRMANFYKLMEAQNEQHIQTNKIKQQQQKAINILIKRINKQVIQSPQLGIDFNETMKNLDKQLPKIPPLPVVAPECPPPYKKADAFTIGMQPPPEPVDKDKGAKQEKKSGGEKGEVPARVFQWEDMPVEKYAIQDHLKSVQNKITFEVQPLSDISRGVIRKQSYPVILGETLFPGQLPKSVVLHLKEAAEALNDRNFILALECYEQGLKAWKQTQVELDPSAELFFQYSKGNIYLSIGKLEYALQIFYGCRKFADTSKLPFINPDRSLPYFGLGQTFYEMQQYQLATRSFLKARQIREGVLGLQHVQTATVFNNLGCCFFMLERAHEALGYIQIAEVVLDTQLGQLHQRTMVCRSNVNKIQHGTFDNQPQYRRFWQVFEEDKFEKKKKKKAKQGKKK